MFFCLTWNVIFFQHSLILKLMKNISSDTQNASAQTSDVWTTWTNVGSSGDYSTFNVAHLAAQMRPWSFLVQIQFNTLHVFTYFHPLLFCIHWTLWRWHRRRTDNLSAGKWSATSQASQLQANVPASQLSCPVLVISSSALPAWLLPLPWSTEAQKRTVETLWPQNVCAIYPK